MQTHKEKSSTITAGADGETHLNEWTHGKLTCRRFPNDPDNVTRISIKGIDDKDFLSEYLIVRGDRNDIIRLLRTAIEAIYIEQKEKDSNE